jgi:hypothetical protein
VLTHPWTAAAMAALATLRAALDPSVRGGDYYGPSGRLPYAGHPVRVTSERLTGASYGLPAAPLAPTETS